MEQFKPVTKQDGAKLRRYYETCNYGICEYSVGTKLMWRPVLHPAWAEIAGCLVVRNEHDGHWVFDYPVAGPEGDEDAALDAIEAYCLEQGRAPVISVVPECKAARLLARYPYVQVSDIRTWRDYVYYREDLQLFAGRRYSGQRNHIKKFRTQWPEAYFRPLTGKDEAVIEQFWKDYEAEFPKGDNAKARDELRLARQMLKMAGKSWFRAGGMFDGEKLVALSLAEKCGDTLIIHIEKALYSYTGVYPTLVQEFACAFGDDCQWINREDDAADRGLRTSKLQYGPAKLAPKYCFEPRNELLTHVREIPELKTERLTLSALTPADIPAYNALVLDQERNRWWGYDDVGGLGGPVEENSFWTASSSARPFSIGLTAGAARSWAAGSTPPTPDTAMAQRRLPLWPTGDCTRFIFPGWWPNASRKIRPLIRCSPPVCAKRERTRRSTILKNWCKATAAAGGIPPAAVFLADPEGRVPAGGRRAV